MIPQSQLCKCGEVLEAYMDIEYGWTIDRLCYPCHISEIREIQKLASESYKKLPKWLRR